MILHVCFCWIGQWLANLLGMGLASRSIHQCSSCTIGSCAKKEGGCQDLLHFQTEQFSVCLILAILSRIFNTYICLLFFFPFPWEKETGFSLVFLQNSSCLLHLFQSEFLNEYLICSYMKYISCKHVFYPTRQQLQQKRTFLLLLFNIG